MKRVLAYLLAIVAYIFFFSFLTLALFLVILGLAMFITWSWPVMPNTEMISLLARTFVGFGILFTIFCTVSEEFNETVNDFEKRLTKR